jgi:hypothetical protein
MAWPQLGAWGSLPRVCLPHERGLAAAERSHPAHVGCRRAWAFMVDACFLLEYGFGEAGLLRGLSVLSARFLLEHGFGEASP